MNIPGMHPGIGTAFILAAMPDLPASAVLRMCQGLQEKIQASGVTCLRNCRHSKLDMVDLAPV
jgi:hypothetical protein